MKALFTKFAVTALLALAPMALHAQTRSIAYGRTTITFAPTLLQTLGSIGATVTDLAQKPLQNGALTFRALEGVIDLQTSLGEVIFGGGYQVTVGATTIRVQDLAFEISSPTTAVISGIFIVNGTGTTRVPVFAVNAQPTYTLPLQPQNGTISLPGLSLGLTPTFVNAINTAAGQAVLTPGTQVGTASAYAVLTPTN